MAIVSTPIIREFRFQGQILPDPAPSFTTEQVREHYAAIYGSIRDAAISAPVHGDGKLIYNFEQAVGRKG